MLADNFLIISGLAAVLFTLVLGGVAIEDAIRGRRG